MSNMCIQTYLSQIHLSRALDQGVVGLCWVLDTRYRAGGFTQPVHCATGHKHCHIPFLRQESGKNLDSLILLAVTQTRPLRFLGYGIAGRQGRFELWLIAVKQLLISMLL